MHRNEQELNKIFARYKSFYYLVYHELMMIYFQLNNIDKCKESIHKMLNELINLSPTVKCNHNINISQCYYNCSQILFYINISKILNKVDTMSTIVINVLLYIDKAIETIKLSSSSPIICENLLQNYLVFKTVVLSYAK